MANEIKKGILKIKQADGTFIEVAPQIDWNQNDNKANGYIENRTHYTISTTEGEPIYANNALSIEQNHETFYTTSFFECQYSEDAQNAFIYKVVWDGVEYICNVKLITDLMYSTYTLAPYTKIVGNASITRSDGKNTGEPFFMYMDQENGGLRIDTYDESGQKQSVHSVTIIPIVEEVKTLDEKYIPQSIARLSTVSEYTDYIYNEMYEGFDDVYEYIDENIFSYVDEHVENLHFNTDFELAKLRSRINQTNDARITLFDCKLSENLYVAQDPDYSGDTIIYGKYGIVSEKQVDGLGTNDKISGVFKYILDGQERTFSTIFNIYNTTGEVISSVFNLSDIADDQVMLEMFIDQEFEFGNGFNLVDKQYACSCEITFSRYMSVERILEVKNSMEVFLYLSSPNYLPLDGKEEYTPTKDYNPATKKYVDDSIFHVISETELITISSVNIQSVVDNEQEYNLGNLSLDENKRYFIEFKGEKRLCSTYQCYGKTSLLCGYEDIFIDIYYYSDGSYYIWVVGYSDDITYTDIILYEQEVTLIDDKYLSTNLMVQNSITMGGRVGDVGSNSIAIGYEVQATLDSALAIGNGAKATGYGSHAEGQSTQATNDYAHAEGTNTIASGRCSHAEGVFTEAKGEGSHAEGNRAVANGICSHAEGFHAEARGQGSHAEGYVSLAKGMYSHVEGEGTISSMDNQHVQGKYNIEDTERKYAHIVGNGDNSYSTNWETVRSNAHTLDWDGNAWYAGQVVGTNLPYDTRKDFNFVFDYSTGYSDIWGSMIVNANIPEDNLDILNNRPKAGEIITISYNEQTYQMPVIVNGESVYVGDDWAFSNEASDFGVEFYEDGISFYVKGESNIPTTPVTVTGAYDTVKELDKKYIPYIAGRDVTGHTFTFIDNSTEVAGQRAEIFNNYEENIATGRWSHAEGSSTIATGDSSHAEGCITTASGDHSHAEGLYSEAIGPHSHAEGIDCVAKGSSSHAEGAYTIASGRYQHVEGTCNIEDTENKYIHIAGNGEVYPPKRSNAHTLDWDGNAWFAGKVTAGTDPTDDMDLTTKKYVDDAIAANSPTIDEDELDSILMEIYGMTDDN